MSASTTSQTYFEIEITADSSDTEIWLGDDEGFFVQMEVGAFRSSLLPGDYVVEFGLGTGCYPIHLRGNSRYTQRGLQAGPPCERPAPTISPD
jgi:hypothetical protein